jgi:hypothetical protein
MGGYRHFGETCCLHYLDRKDFFPEDRGSRFLRNTGNHRNDYTVSPLIKSQSIFLPKIQTGPSEKSVTSHKLYGVTAKKITSYVYPEDGGSKILRNIDN